QDRRNTPPGRRQVLTPSRRGMKPQRSSPVFPGPWRLVAFALKNPPFGWQGAPVYAASPSAHRSLARIVFHAENRYFPEMKTRFARFLSLLLLLSSLAGLAVADAPFTGGRWIDLTHEFSSETLYWPTAESFTLETEFHGQTPKGYFYAANRYRASEHGGTHIDAPI